MKIAVCILCVLCCIGCSREPEPLKTMHGTTVRLVSPHDVKRCEFGGYIPGTRTPEPIPFCKKTAVVMLGDTPLCGEHYLSMWEAGDPTLTEIRQHDQR